MASSTGYGIFVELNVADLYVLEELTCYGPSAEGFSVESMKIEEPGKYFHPLLATLITGAARLMLAIAETLCFEKGLDWAFAILTVWPSTSRTGWTKPIFMSVPNRYAIGFRR